MGSGEVAPPSGIFDSSWSWALATGSSSRAATDTRAADLESKGIAVEVDRRPIEPHEGVEREAIVARPIGLEEKRRRVRLLCVGGPKMEMLMGKSG